MNSTELLLSRYPNTNWYDRLAFAEVKGRDRQTERETSRQTDKERAAPFGAT